MDFIGTNKRQCGIARGDQEKGMWNIKGSWFKVLKFLWVVTQFCRASRGEGLYFLEFPGIK